MQLLIASTLFGGLALASCAAAQTTTAQACPGKDVSIYESCICPYGTEYQISTTYATLGVNVADFKKYTGHFYDLSWLNINNLTRHGPDDTVGSYRSFNATLQGASLTFSEKLDLLQTKADGSYITKFSQYNVPIPYPDGTGSFGGYWGTVNAQYAAPYETVLWWNVYACFTGHPIPYATAHERTLTNLMATMQKAGLVKGNLTTWYSSQSF